MKSVLIWGSLFLAVALLPGSISALEVYPSPGTNTYISSRYRVEVWDGFQWLDSYTYQYSRVSMTPWHMGSSPSLSFTTFGTATSVSVRVTRLAGSITSMAISPKSKAITAQLLSGQAIFTLKPNDKTWIVINGDDANPLFVFADPPKPAVPSGATYFGPGIYGIAPATQNHYHATSNEVIYIDGGAWVRGNIDVRGASNVQIMGPGVLSGDLWTAETVQGLQPWPAPLDYALVTGDWASVNVSLIQGVTFVNSPTFNISAGVDQVTGVKLLSPWYWSTDGFQSGVSRVDQSFAFVGDNVFFPTWAGLHNNDVVVTNCFAGSTNNTVFTGGYWGNHPSNTHTTFVDNVDIKTYNSDFWSPLTPGVFQLWVDNADPTYGYFNQTYQNIRVEGSLTVPLAQVKNLVHPWVNVGQPAPDPPLGNSRNIIFKNISLEGTQKYRSEIKGWDSQNGFHGVALENVSINGTRVTPANISNYFDVNAFVWGLRYTALSPCDVNGNTQTDVSDVQLEVNMAIGASSCTGDINVDGSCNVIDVQRVVIAALGGTCVSP